MASLTEVVEFADQYLNISKFNDYCPNGLQVEGRPEVKKIITGVSASQEFLDAASLRGADLVLVHHGFFWKGEAQTIVGVKLKKIKTLLKNDMSLLAYHLPLDAHCICGNNVQLASKFGLTVKSLIGSGDIPLVAKCEFEEPLKVKNFVDQVAIVLGRDPVHIGVNKSKMIKTIGICTGGAQGYFQDVIDHGLDAYLTGEISEQHYHMAMETGVDFIAAGHHATERFGVQSLGRILAEKFSIEVEYIEIHNPI